MEKPLEGREMRLIGARIMNDFNQREYQRIVLGALLYVDRSRFIGDIGKGD
jgi:hypothetical protein